MLPVNVSVAKASACCALSQKSKALGSLVLGMMDINEMTPTQQAKISGIMRMMDKVSRLICVIFQ